MNLLIFKWWPALIKSFKDPVPKPGEIWGYEVENPFKRPIRVKVLAIEKGYVQFERIANDIDSARVSTFIRVYKKVENEPTCKLV